MQVFSIFVGLCFWVFGVIGFAYVCKNGFRWPTGSAPKSPNNSGHRHRIDGDIASTPAAG